jgi:hypothetical protein
VAPALGAWWKKAPLVTSPAREQRPSPFWFREHPTQTFERLGARILRALRVRRTERDRPIAE